MTEGKTIGKTRFNSLGPEEDYYKCVFDICNFSGSAPIQAGFEDCVFRQCDFSLAKFSGYFNNVRFVECKMTGADLSQIQRFSGAFCFEDSRLDYVSFFGLKIRKSRFSGCCLHEAHFEEADLSFSVFGRCDLAGAFFRETNLEKADFSTAYNFSIDPGLNRLKKTVFPESELRGLVAHLDIVIKRF